MKKCVRGWAAMKQLCSFVHIQKHVSNPSVPYRSPMNRTFSTKGIIHCDSEDMGIPIPHAQSYCEFLPRSALSRNVHEDWHSGRHAKNFETCDER